MRFRNKTLPAMSSLRKRTEVRGRRRVAYSMGNNLLSVWSTIGSVALAIFILLAMITIHEFGHWLAGKILHFKINEFSIGFGPALFKRKGKKTGEIFALRLIPLGGYCAFDGEDGLEEEEPAPVFEEEQPNDGERVLLTPAEESAPAEKKEAEQTPGQRRKENGKFTEMKPWKRIIVLVAGAFMNYLLALFLILICFSAYGQTMLAVYEVEPTDDIPAAYCLQDKDIFLQAEGKNLYLTTDLARALNGKKAGDRVSLYISRIVSQEKDEEGKVVKTEREKMNVEIILRSDVSVKNSAQLDSAWAALGVKHSEEQGYMLASGTQKFGFFETIGRSFMYSFKIAGSIFKVIGELLTGNLGISALGGPITTITMTSQVASQSFRSFLEIASFIGVNLAVFNLLPIPALDGSKVVFTVIEWVRGKPISRKVEAIIHAVGFVLLLGFAVLVDILQFVI